MEQMVQQERVRRLAERIKCELAEHLEDADRNAGAYIDGYVGALLGGRQARPQARGLHPKVGELVRELVLDASAGDAMVRRR